MPGSPHNPLALPAEIIGPRHRLLVVGEIIPQHAERWSVAENAWRPTALAGIEVGSPAVPDTYRIRDGSAPLQPHRAQPRSRPSPTARRNRLHEVIAECINALESGPEVGAPYEPHHHEQQIAAARRAREILLESSQAPAA